MPHSDSSRLLLYTDFRWALSGANIHENAVSVAKTTRGGWARSTEVIPFKRSLDFAERPSLGLSMMTKSQSMNYGEKEEQGQWRQSDYWWERGRALGPADMHSAGLADWRWEGDQA